MARKYVIVNTSELSSLNYNELLTTSADTARRNLAKDKALVSYDGTIPEALNSKTQYTLEEIKAIVDDVNNGWDIE